MHTLFTNLGSNKHGSNHSLISNKSIRIVPWSNKHLNSSVKASFVSSLPLLTNTAVNLIYSIALNRLRVIPVGCRGTVYPENERPVRFKSRNFLHLYLLLGCKKHESFTIQIHQKYIRFVLFLENKIVTKKVFI